MEPKYISFQKYCRERYVSSPDPSFSQNIFTLEAFQSEDFVDNISNYLSSKVSETIKSSQKHLQALVNHINQQFEAVRQGLVSFQETFMRKTLAYYSNSDITEELALLRCEMKRCHRKILLNDHNPLLIEELAKLVDKYKSMTLRTDISDFKNKIEKISKGVTSIVDEIKEIQEKYSKIATFEDIMPFTLEKKTQVKAQYNERKMCTLNDRKEAQNEGILFEFQKRNYFFFATQLKPTSFNRETFDIIDVKNGKTIFSLPSNEETSRTRGKIFGAAPNISTIIVQDSKHFTLNFYRLTSKGMKRFTTIPLGLLTTNNISRMLGLSEKIVFDFIEGQHMLALAYESYFKLFNIFTRKTIIERSYNERICDIKYLKDLNYLIVLLISGKIEIYDVLSGGTILHLKHLIKADVTDVPIRIYAAGNIIMIHECAECKQPANETKTFHLFRINQNEIKNYRVVLSYDLRVPNVIILPQQKKVKINFYPNFADARIYNYNLETEKPEEEEQGLIMWGDEDNIILIQKGTLYIKEKTKAQVQKVKKTDEKHSGNRIDKIIELT